MKLDKVFESADPYAVARKQIWSLQQLFVSPSGDILTSRRETTMTVGHRQYDSVNKRRECVYERATQR